MQIKKQRLYVQDVAIDVFYDRNCNFNLEKTAVINLCGFPDFAGPNEMTTLQVSFGNIVFQPHMKGTFDSGGLFGPNGIKETMTCLNTIIWASKASSLPLGELEIMPWKIKKVILVGHSFGGIIELRYFNLIEKLNSIIFMSPAVHYADKYGCDENGPDHYAEVDQKYPFTYRLDSIKNWGGILEGKDVLPNEPIGSVKNVAVIYGEADRYFDIGLAKKEVPNLIKCYIKADSYMFDVIEKAGHPLAETLHDSKAINIIKGICSDK